MMFSLLLGLMLIGSITASTFFWSSPHNTTPNFLIKSMNSAAETASSSNIAAATAQTDTYKPLAITSDDKTSKSISDLQQNTNQLRQLEQSIQKIKQKYDYGLWIS
jgi:uncharacterized protein YlxW (UPF0749 family)